MPRGFSLSKQEQGKILAFKDQNLKFREIARKLGRSVTVVRNFLSNPENYGQTKRSGRKKILTQREIAHINRLASNSTLSLKSIKASTGVSAATTPSYGGKVTVRQRKYAN